MSDIQLAVHDGRITTTSLTVAEHFGRDHKNVLRAVQQLDCSPEFRRLNFEPCTYRAGNGRDETMYEMTRDGFTFLAMGFAGPKAAHMKEAYIGAFNRMEYELIAQIPRPGQADALEAQRLRAQVDQLKDEALDLLRYKVSVLSRPKRIRKPTTPVTRDEVEKILRLRAQGLSGQEIARRIGRSSGTVSFILRGAGAATPQQPQGDLL